MFQLTRKADYAVRLMLEVGCNNGERVSTAEVAQRQDVPYQFLRKVAQELVACKLLISDRGLRGGLRLARSADSITMLDIVSAIEEPALNDCTVVPSACDRRDMCAAFPVWLMAQNQLEQLLSQARLSELVDRQLARTPALRRKRPIRDRHPRSSTKGRMARAKSRGSNAL